MANSLPLRLARSLFQRRPRRHTWAYVLWLFAYVPAAWLFAGDTGAQVYQLWPLLVPVVIVVAQMMYTTLVGWVVIVVPSALYSGVGVFYLIRNATETPPQWQYDSSGFIMGLIFIGAFVAVCVALIFARPRLKDVTVII
jgi:hypothetical protein